MRKRISPYFIIVVGFFAIILIGFLLLLLPISTRGGIKAVDALFLSASAVCITGLSPINLAETLTGFGQAVVALLIQIGGLGFVTIAMTALVVLKARLGISNRRLVDEALGSSGRLNYKEFLLRVVLFTAVMELIGFIVDLLSLMGDYHGGKLVWISLFHAISAFNNAGLDLFGTGMLGYKDNVPLLLNTAVLTIVGGLGFIVINDLVCARRWRRFSVHTKIVLVMTPVLLAFGTLMFFFTEWGKIDLLNAFFMSAMSRTCGFSTQDLSGWSNASLCILNLLMFIGAGPVSTGGGVKCTTVFVFLVAMASLFSGKSPTVFHRRLAHSTVIKAALLIVLAMVYVFATGTAICWIEPDLRLAFIYTETISAFANVGFSAGITAELSVASKLILTLAMFVGRVGFMTTLLVFKRNWNRRESEAVRYVEAEVIIG